MDILDTPMDWVQMIGAIAFVIFVSGPLINAAHQIKIPFIVIGLLAYFLFWKEIYDYDYVIVLLIGGMWGLKSSISVYRDATNGTTVLSPPPDNLEERYVRIESVRDTAVSVSFHCFSIVVIMILKMILFW